LTGVLFLALSGSPLHELGRFSDRNPFNVTLPPNALPRVRARAGKYLCKRQASVGSVRLPVEGRIHSRHVSLCIFMREGCMPSAGASCACVHPPVPASILHHCSPPTPPSTPPSHLHPPCVALSSISSIPLPPLPSPSSTPQIPRVTASFERVSMCLAVANGSGARYGPLTLTWSEKCLIDWPHYPPSSR
jgi:hypothetical protein